MSVTILLILLGVLIEGAATLWQNHKILSLIRSHGISPEDRQALREATAKLKGSAGDLAVAEGKTKVPGK